MFSLIFSNRRRIGKISPFSTLQNCSTLNRDRFPIIYSFLPRDFSSDSAAVTAIKYEFCFRVLVRLYICSVFELRVDLSNCASFDLHKLGTQSQNVIIFLPSLTVSELSVVKDDWRIRQQLFNVSFSL